MNTSPDIFLSASLYTGADTASWLLSGNAVEVELAVSSVVGSGLFICSISLAAVILVSPVEIRDRVAFVSRRPSLTGTPHTGRFLNAGHHAGGL